MRVWPKIMTWNAWNLSKFLMRNWKSRKFIERSATIFLLVENLSTCHFFGFFYGKNICISRVVKGVAFSDARKSVNTLEHGVYLSTLLVVDCLYRYIFLQRQRHVTDKPMSQDEVNENLLREPSYKNDSSYTDFKRLEEEDVEK